MNIVIIDDDRDAHDFISWFLEAEGHKVYSIYTGLAGLEIVKSYDLDLILLDVFLPQLNGWELCQHIRSFSEVPILMMSAIAQADEDIIRGLDLGADDYITKPIRLEILKARINALLRRSSKTKRYKSPRYYSDQYLTIDLDQRAVWVKGSRQSLSPLEYRLLELLVTNADELVPTAEIIEELWNETDSEYESFVPYVRIYVHRLREILQGPPGIPGYIVTEHGLGYRFVRRS